MFVGYFEIRNCLRCRVACFFNSAAPLSRILVLRPLSYGHKDPLLPFPAFLQRRRVIKHLYRVPFCAHENGENEARREIEFLLLCSPLMDNFTSTWPARPTCLMNIACFSSRVCTRTKNDTPKTLSSSKQTCVATFVSREGGA